MLEVGLNQPLLQQVNQLRQLNQPSQCLHFFKFKQNKWANNINFILSVVPQTNYDCSRHILSKTVLLLTRISYSPTLQYNITIQYILSYYFTTLQYNTYCHQYSAQTAADTNSLGAEILVVLLLNTHSDGSYVAPSPYLRSHK
jgi:hypothetical protein